VHEYIIESVPEQTQCLEGRVNSHGEWTSDQAEICYVVGMSLLIRTAQSNSHTQRCSWAKPEITHERVSFAAEYCNQYFLCQLGYIALIYTGTVQGVDLTGLLGDIKEDWRSGGQKSPSGVQGRSPGRGSGGQSPPQAEAIFCETTHNICIKIQQTVCTRKSYSQRHPLSLGSWT